MICIGLHPFKTPQHSNIDPTTLFAYSLQIKIPYKIKLYQMDVVKKLQAFSLFFSANKPPLVQYWQ